jgi:hypothetical protein
MAGLRCAENRRAAPIRRCGVGQAFLPDKNWQPVFHSASLEWLTYEMQHADAEPWAWHAALQAGSGRGADPCG